MSNNNATANNNKQNQNSPNENKENMNTTITSSAKRRAPVLSPSLVEAAHKKEHTNNSKLDGSCDVEDNNASTNNKEIIRSSNKVTKKYSIEKTSLEKLSIF